MSIEKLRWMVRDSLIAALTALGAYIYVPIGTSADCSPGDQKKNSFRKARFLALPLSGVLSPARRTLPLLLLQEASVMICPSDFKNCRPPIWFHFSFPLGLSLRYRGFIDWGKTEQANHLGGGLVLQKKDPTFWRRTSTVENEKKYGIFLKQIRYSPYSLFLSLL